VGRSPSVAAVQMDRMSRTKKRSHRIVTEPCHVHVVT
jgi:hypothetical protein